MGVQTFPTEAQLERAKSELKLMSIYSGVEDWLARAIDERQGNSPEAHLAAHVVDKLVELQAELDQMIDRLAPRAVAISLEDEAA